MIEAIFLADEKIKTRTGINGGHPISLLDINNRPLIEYQLNYLDNWNVEHLIIAHNERNNEIEKHLGDKYKSIHIEYIEGLDKLGSGGAIKKAFEKINAPNIFVFRGNTFFDVSLRRFFNFKRIKETSLVIALRFITEENVEGAIEVDPDSKIIDFVDKVDPYGEVYINGGIYCVSAAYVKNKSLPDQFSFEEDLIKKYYKADSFYGFKCYSSYIDVASAEDLNKIESEFRRLPY